LFNQTKDKYRGHILPEVNLRELKTANDNKCHTDKSRNAAYTLFQTMIGLSDD
jgi:hypothetical protein